MASNYHWTKSEILDGVYLDEAIEYMNAIKRHKTQEYLIQLAIVSNPHTKKPETLFKELQNELKKFDKKGMIEATPDADAFTKLKHIFNKGK